jgi:uncharacterized protein (DUF1778 family)
MGAPEGNQNRKGKLKPDRIDDHLCIRIKSDLKQEIINNAEALGITLTQFVIRSTTGKR